MAYYNPYLSQLDKEILLQSGGNVPAQATNVIPIDPTVNEPQEGFGSRLGISLAQRANKPTISKALNIKKEQGKEIQKQVKDEKEVKVGEDISGSQKTYDIDTLLAAVDKLKNKLPGQKDTLAEAEEMERQAQLLKQRNQGFAGADLSPLMAYADYLSGGNLAKSYKAPDDNMKDAMALLREAGKLRTQARKMPLDYVKAATGEDKYKAQKLVIDTSGTKQTDTDKFLSTISDLVKSSTGGQPKPDKMSDYERMYSTQIFKMADASEAVMKIKDIAAGDMDNPALVGQMLFGFAKLAQPNGVLTKQDYDTASKGDPRITANIERWVSSSFDANTLTGTDRDLYRQAAARLARSKLKEMTRKLDRMAYTTAQKTGEDIKEIRERFYTFANLDPSSISSINRQFDIMESTATSNLSKSLPNRGGVKPTNRLDAINKRLAEINAALGVSK